VDLELTESNILEKIDFNHLDELSKDKIKEVISIFEKSMLEGEQIEIPIKHQFSKNLYAREMTVQKGSLIVGKIHKHQNMSIISKGEVSVLSIDGEMRIKAPHTFVSNPGVKRLIYAHEDTVWTTVHATEETDIDKIEEELIAKDYSEVEEINLTLTTEVKKCLL